MAKGRITITIPEGYELRLSDLAEDHHKRSVSAVVTEGLSLYMKETYPSILLDFLFREFHANETNEYITKRVKTLYPGLEVPKDFIVWYRGYTRKIDNGVPTNRQATSG